MWMNQDKTMAATVEAIEAMHPTEISMNGFVIYRKTCYYPIKPII